MRELRSASLLSLILFAAAAACSDPPPPKAPAQSEGVPANSLSDARLHGEETDEDAARRQSKPDPTSPYVTVVGEEPPAEEAAPAAAAPTGGGKGAVSKPECDRAMDKYLELEIAKNPQLSGLPPEVIAQAKQMARQQHGEAPCTATRAQYACAMAATSTAAWQRCMK